MKITICDDSLRDLRKLEQLLLAFQDLYPSTPFEIETYSDACLLSRNIQEHKPADIYILDMIMEPMTGIDIGRQLRGLGTEAAIIYITTSDDFALDAYGVHALRYLLKPVSQEPLFEALRCALSQARTRQEPVYLLKTREGLVSIPYSKIEYIENASRTLEVHLAGGAVEKSIFIRKSFDEEISELVFDEQFVQVHKSFLINLNYVRQLARNRVTMESGSAVPVSQKRAALVRDNYLSFISDFYKQG